jgi:hypothetical protein
MYISNKKHEKICIYIYMIDSDRRPVSNRCPLLKSASTDLWVMRFVYYNIWLPWSAKVDSTPIGKTIIFDGKLWLFKRAYRYESLERMPIWEYPKIGPWGLGLRLGLGLGLGLRLGLGLVLVSAKVEVHRNLVLSLLHHCFKNIP